MLALSISRSFPLKPRSNTVRSLTNLLASPNGLPCDSLELQRELVTTQGGTRKLPFFFDTGADHMVIPVYVARLIGIRYREEFPGTMSSSMGGSVRCHYDFVQVRSSLSGKTHRWICAFADSLQARLIVGRSGLLDEFAVAVTGRRLVVSRSVSLRRFLRHHAARLSARAHSSDEWGPI